MPRVIRTWLLAAVVLVFAGSALADEAPPPRRPTATRPATGPSSRPSTLPAVGMAASVALATGGVWAIRRAGGGRGAR